MQFSETAQELARPTCRGCGAALVQTFVDLGLSPLANSYVAPDKVQQPESFYPLHVYVCDRCFLVQLPAAAAPAEIFQDYAYFSSYSVSWVKHAEAYVQTMLAERPWSRESLVVEIASNDGYLLQFFKQQSIDVLGIEPAANVARVAEAAGIPSWVTFFGRATAHELACQGRTADLLVANNVLAHVPDLHDFVAGIAIALKPAGLATFEFPHLLRLMEETQFDTIYHEHFSYFSLLAVEPVFRSHDLAVVDVEELPTHGGSLRLHVRHAGADATPGRRVAELTEREVAAGLGAVDTYRRFGERVREVKAELLECLIALRRRGATIVGYGAPAKGNTLLNYCGVRGDFLEYTVDRSPHKQGHYLPGSRVPIYAPEHIAATKPDYVLILPWNLRDEIMEQMAVIRSWGGRFIVPVPRVEIC
jgi:SAM-dependent methyltransferase